MNAQTKLSAKGQIVLPKAVRDRMGLSIGDSFDVIEERGSIVLRPRIEPKKGRSVEQALAELRKIYVHKGPPLPIDRLSWSPDIDDNAEASR